MFLKLLIRFFTNRLSDESCVKLYATLLMSQDKSLNAQEAINKAFLSDRQDLRLKLFNIICYGPLF